MKTKNILEQNINTLKKYFEKYKNKEKNSDCFYSNCNNSNSCGNDNGNRIRKIFIYSVCKKQANGRA